MAGAGQRGVCLAVLALGGFGLYQVAGRHWQVQPTFRVRAQFETISGLEAGHRVRLQGIDAGVVERVVPPREPGRPVELVLRIDERLRPLVRTDAVARIVSEGLVGAKVVELTPGRPDAPRLAELRQDRLRAADRDDRPAQEGRRRRWRGSTPPPRPPSKGWASSTRSPARFAAAKAAWASSFATRRSIRTCSNCRIAASARLTALEENLTALKQTWPLSRYFERRAYLDRERVLFQPGASGIAAPCAPMTCSNPAARS